MVPAIRSPQASDQTGWHRLWSAYLDFYQVRLAPDVTDRTRRCLLEETNPMFGRLALLDAQIVGFTISVSHETSWSVQPTCYLEDLFVCPSARRAGIARALIDDLIGYGRSQGFASLYWHTRSDNRIARRAYDRFTTPDDFIRYRLPLN